MITIIPQAGYRWPLVGWSALELVMKPTLAHPLSVVQPLAVHQ